ncbi:hypothetical protein OsJ_13012 [Oryza sativa Japonica Group]|uniref:Cupin type-1 domain-containing protein n=1 Tax=Oryza sativa subsp. japonica TaxID=39947 RepID=B9F6J8_ORYSJ|nr:hypothetical protein OsJ_13012 [Oryza sativa Japonica Group]
MSRTSSSAPLLVLTPDGESTAVISDDFFFAGNTENRFGFNATLGNVQAFPGLNTLGVSINRGDFAPGGLNALHSHPRAAELYNVGDVAAQVITAFNSQLPGVVAAAPSLFGSDPEIPDAVLAENYQVDVKIIRLLKSKF